MSVVAADAALTTARSPRPDPHDAKRLKLNGVSARDADPASVLHTLGTSPRTDLSSDTSAGAAPTTRPLVSPAPRGANHVKFTHAPEHAVELRTGRSMPMMLVNAGSTALVAGDLQYLGEAIPLGWHVVVKAVKHEWKARTVPALAPGYQLTRYGQRSLGAGVFERNVGGAGGFQAVWHEVLHNQRPGTLWSLKGSNPAFATERSFTGFTSTP